MKIKNGELLTVSLEQWQVLQAVADEGGFQAAADRLQKSQSTVSYTLQKLQDNLGVRLFEYRGRRAQLTEQGHLILRRARDLLEQAGKLEKAARELASGWEAQLSMVVDVIFPEAVLLDALSAFAPLSRGARLDIFSHALSGTQDMLVQAQVDLAVVGMVPPGFLGDKLLDVEFIAVAHAAHELHRETSPIGEEQLRQHRQIVVRDSGAYRRLSAGWLGAEERWTVTDFKDSVSYLKAGLGFAFMPRHFIEQELESGEFKALPLEYGSRRQVASHLVYADRSNAGPGTKALAQALMEACKRHRSHKA